MNTPEYSIETPVVYNLALDEITPEKDIKLIVIGDNPGKKEQLRLNQRYLVGQAGKLAEGFFNRNEKLGIDFRDNVIILNKTPIHTAKTVNLRYLLKEGTPSITELINTSQIWMAEKTAELHKAFFAETKSDAPELWLVGYSEIKNKGLFVDYRDTFMNSYRTSHGTDPAWNKVYVYQHFSMNRFQIDLSAFMKKEQIKNMEQALKKLGSAHKQELFPFVKK